MLYTSNAARQFFVAEVDFFAISAASQIVYTRVGIAPTSLGVGAVVQGTTFYDTISTIRVGLAENTAAEDMTVAKTLVVTAQWSLADVNLSIRARGVKTIVE
jgi:hypothetical protein